MALIQKNDVVGPSRDLDDNLTAGLVGKVLQCYEDSYDVEFPLQGADNIHARVNAEDIKLIVGTERFES